MALLFAVWCKVWILHSQGLNSSLIMRGEPLLAQVSFAPACLDFFLVVTLPDPSSGSKDSVLQSSDSSVTELLLMCLSASPPAKVE